ncbi:MAG: hypothetical protein IIY16_07495 [Oscillospiraceae bacterium]|nr:hypothetical protein [Oscillospiraceae bacterium]
MRFGDNFASLYGMAANAAGSAKKKAAILGAIAKANVSIYSEEDKIKKAEAELGRLYYNDFIAGSSRSSEAYEEVCKRITESRSRIAELKGSIADLRAQLGENAVIDPDEVTDEDFVAAEEVPAETNKEEATE